MLWLHGYEKFQQDTGWKLKLYGMLFILKKKKKIVLAWTVTKANAKISLGMEKQIFACPFLKLKTSKALHLQTSAM